MDSHETLFSDIYREILNLCDKIAGNIYRFIRRNDIEDREILDLCNQIDNSKMMELVAENKDKFVKFLRLIQHAQKHEDGIELEDGVNAIEQFDPYVGEDIIFPKTLEYAKLLIALSEIDDILSEKKRVAQLEGAVDSRRYSKFQK